MEIFVEPLLMLEPAFTGGADQTHQKQERQRYENERYHQHVANHALLDSGFFPLKPFGNKG